MGKRADSAKGGKTVKVVTETIENRIEPEEEIGGEGADLAEDADTLEDSDALMELESLAGSGARYEIRRTAPAGFTGYVGTYPRDTFTPDLLQKEWGGGNFTLRVKNSRGEYVGSRQIVLAGDAHHKKEAVTPAVASTGDNGLASVLTAINASNQAAQAASKDQIGLLTTLVMGLINKPAPAAPDPLAMISALKDVLKPDKGGGAGDAVSMLLKGIDLGKSLAGEGGETNMMDLVAKGFDTIKDAAALAPPPAPVRPVAPPQRQLAAPTAPAAGTVPAELPTGAEPVSNEMKQLQWLRGQVVVLSRLAAAKKDPELYAEVFLDNLPEFMPAQLVYDQMSAPGALGKLAMIAPAVAQHQEWFEKFRAAVVDLLEDEGDESGEESGEDQLDAGAPLPPAGEPSPEGEGS